MDDFIKKINISPESTSAVDSVFEQLKTDDRNKQFFSEIKSRMDDFYNGLDAAIRFFNESHTVLGTEIGEVRDHSNTLSDDLVEFKKKVDSYWNEILAQIDNVPDYSDTFSSIEASIEHVKTLIPLPDDLIGKVIQEVTKNIKIPRTPVKGVDYFDGQPGSNTNPQQVVDLILGSKILKPDHIDGFEQTIQALIEQFSLQRGRGYIHGGGDTVKAGTNITLTRNADGTVTINSTASGSVVSVSATSPITSTGGTTPVISTSISTNKLVGRGTAGTGVMEEISIGTNLSLSGTTLNATVPTPVPAVSIQDTEYNILALTPTAGLLAWATDLGQFMTANGSNWYIDSSYLSLDLQNPDLGYIQGSNRSGYGQAYVTDKIISNSALGDNANTTTGGLRYNATGLNGTAAIQAYFNSVWNNIVAGFNFQEVNGVLETVPMGYTQRILVYSGNSDLLGLNGLPIIQGYKVSLGPYPVQPQIVGGTF